MSGLLKNVDPGSSTGRFRPLGVPTEFVDRGSEPPLGIPDLVSASGGLPVIAVLITSKELNDGREGFEMARPPDEQAIVDRMVKWWPIGRQEVGRWGSEPDKKPGLLIAMSGTINRRVIVAALQIDQNIEAHWEPAPKAIGKYKIPVTPFEKLDYASLRGRIVKKEVGHSNQSGIRIIKPDKLA